MRPCRRRQRQRRGAALLLVLIAMASAMTMVLGWLASQDNSPLVAANARRAASARSSAQCGLELAAAMLQSDAPWKTAHTDGWILQQHALAGSVVDVRLIDDQTNLPPTIDTTIVRIESTAASDGMTQIATALATVHPFDERSMSDYSGYAIFASGDLLIDRRSQIQLWGDPSSTPSRIGVMGDQHLLGRSNRELRQGRLIMHMDMESTWHSKGTPLPTILGPIAYERDEGHTLMASSNDEESHLSPWQHRLISEDAVFPGDLHLGYGAHLEVVGDVVLEVAGDLTLQDAASITVHEDGKLTLIIGGDLEMEGAVIGAAQESDPRFGPWTTSRIKDTAHSRITIEQPLGVDDGNWQIENQSLVQAVIEAPQANITVDQATVTGRLCGHHVSMQRGARLYWDPEINSNSGLAELTEFVDQLDLMGLRDDGLDSFERLNQLDRLQDLLDRPADDPYTTPTDGWWVKRPYPVDWSMTRCGGDVTKWEQVARLCRVTE